MVKTTTMGWIGRIAAAAALWGAAVVSGCGNDTVSTSSGIDSGTADVTTVTCTAPQKNCGGACADTTSDFDNCGACGNKCASGQVCSQGACALFCSGGTTQCGTSCVTTQSDPANCGTCATACKTGEVCSAGKCALTCAGGATQCGAACVDTTIDGKNCGTCGNTCPTGNVCSAGKCGISCGVGLTACGGADAGGDGGAPFCADTKNDGRNCGQCDKTCDAGNVCVNGACQLTCPTGEIKCAGKCIDPLSDPTYCGASASCGTDDAGTAGTTCSAGNVCANGTCAVSCPGTQINCNGVCVDGQTNNTYCGATGACGAGDAGGSAGVTCPAGNVCVAGSCGVSCPGTEANCNGVCTNGQTDRAHCGATGLCGTGGSGAAGAVCPAGQVCNAGACAATCATGLTLCGTACVDTKTDTSNCGACGIACSSCTAGACPLVNGSFEGDYTGWTLKDTGPTVATWAMAHTGTAIPAGATLFDYFTRTDIVQLTPGLPATYTAPNGRFVALQVQRGPCDHRAYQTITIPAAATTLSLSVQYRNGNGAFDATQQYLAFTLRDPLTDAVLTTLYKTTQGTDPQTQAMATKTFNVAAFAGQTVRFDIDLQVQLTFFDAAFDNVVIQ